MTLHNLNLMNFISRVFLCIVPLKDKGNHGFPQLPICVTLKTLSPYYPFQLFSDIYLMFVR